MIGTQVQVILLSTLGCVLADIPNLLECASTCDYFLTIKLLSYLGFLMGVYEAGHAAISVITTILQALSRLLGRECDDSIIVVGAQLIISLTVHHVMCYWWTIYQQYCFCLRFDSCTDPVMKAISQIKADKCELQYETQTKMSFCAKLYNELPQLLLSGGFTLTFFVHRGFELLFQKAQIQQQAPARGQVPNSDPPPQEPPNARTQPQEPPSTSTQLQEQPNESTQPQEQPNESTQPQEQPNASTHPQQPPNANTPPQQAPTEPPLQQSPNINEDRTTPCSNEPNNDRKSNLGANGISGHRHSSRPINSSSANRRSPSRVRGRNPGSSDSSDDSSFEDFQQCTIRCEQCTGVFQIASVPNPLLLPCTACTRDSIHFRSNVSNVHELNTELKARFKAEIWKNMEELLNIVKNLLCDNCERQLARCRQ